MVSLEMLLAMLLLVCSGVVGCKWHNSSNAMLNGQMACALRKRAPNSALATLAMTVFMIWHRTWMGLLSGGGSSVVVGGMVGRELRKQYPVVRDLPLGAVR